MQDRPSQITQWIEKLVDEKIRLESIKAKRDELIRKNISRDLIDSGVDEARRKIAEARVELGKLIGELDRR